MSRLHTGAQSKVDYVIPELDDVGDVEVAFSDFADSIPPSPAAIKSVTVTADVAVPVLNTLYVFDGTGPNTVTLIPGLNDGDKIQILQMQAGTVTVIPNNVAYQGPNVTTGQFSALTLTWQATEGRWIAVPFFSSGISFPPSSGGGDDIIDAGGFRYHIFRNDGSFYAHQDMLVNAIILAAGGDGAPAGTLPGDGGSPGAYQFLQGFHVDVMQSYPVRVGKSPDADGQPTSFHRETVAGGMAGIADTVTPVEAPMPLPAGVAAVLGYTEVGGTGAADVGPVQPSTYGKGGGGAHLTLPPQTRPSHTETINHPGTPGTPGSSGTNVTGASTYECNCRDEIVNGDTMACYGGLVACGNGLCCVAGTACTSCAGPGACPGGWWIAPGGGHCQTSVRRCDTCYSCPGGWYQCGSNCCQDWSTPGTPGTPGWTETVTVWDPCPAEYKVDPTNSQRCIDARGVGPGEAGNGLAVIWYPYDSNALPPDSGGTPQPPTQPPTQPPPVLTHNAATGGTVADIDDYLGSGQKWRTHTFEAVGMWDLAVTSSIEPFSVLLVAGGGDGDNGGHPGQGGQVFANKAVQMPVGNYTVNVGDRTRPSALTHKETGDTIASAAAGASQGQSAGGGVYSDISGTNRGYAGNGGKVWWNYCCPSNGDAPGPGGGSWRDWGGASYYGAGGGGQQHTSPAGQQPGHRGIIIVAYRIG